MMYPIIGAYRLDDKVRIEVDGVLREGKIICIGLNGYVVAADACVFVVNDPQIEWCARTSGENEPGEEIKVGDRVVAHVGPNMDWYGTVKKIIPDTDGLYGENLLRIRVDGGCLLEHRVSRCTKLENKPNVGTITIPVKADLDDTYWDAYKAELAKELAVKLANEETITTPATADYITDFATRIVDNLKKQSE